MRRVRDFSQYRSRVKRDDIKDCVKNVLGVRFIEPPGVLPINLLPAVGSVAGSTIVDLQTGTPSSLSMPALLSVAAAAVAKFKVTYNGNGNDTPASIITGGTAYKSSGDNPASYVCDGSTSSVLSLTDYGNQWWKYDFGSGVTKKFGLIGYHNAGNQAYVPKNVIVQGSNDDSSWTDLETIVFNNSTGLQTYGVTPGEFRYFRLWFIDNWNGSGQTYLWELYFYNATGDSNWYASGATVTVRKNCFTKSGKTFSKWNTAADGSGTDYNPAATFTISAPTTLYAIWV